MPAPRPVPKSSGLLDDPARWERVKQALWETNLAAPIRGVYGLLNADPYTLYTDEGAAGEQAAVDAFDAGSGVMVGGSVVPKPANAVSMGFKAYHGSPHKFDKFDATKIGTGEGAQAYGVGAAYLAGQEGVAKSYRKDLGYKHLKKRFLDELPQDADFEEVDALIAQGYFTPDQTALLTELKNNDWLGFDYPSQAITAAMRKNLDNWDPSPELKDAAAKVGHMYEVNVNADPNMMLDWDAPIQEQPPHLQKLIADMLADPGRGVGYVQDPEGLPISGGNLYNGLAAKLGGKAAASKALQDAGAPGIRYHDGASRGAAQSYADEISYYERTIAQNKQHMEKLRENPTARGYIKQYEDYQVEMEKKLAEAKANAAQATHNYVVFDENDLEILRRYGLVGLLGSGAAAASLADPTNQKEY